MAAIFIKVSEVIQGTPIGGNIDVDRLSPSIIDVQVMTILPLLGQTLYELLMLEIEDSTLSAQNTTLLNDYVKPIMRHLVAADFIENSSYMVANGGVFKHQPKDAVAVDKSEVQYLAQIQRSKAQTHISRCENWLCKNGLGYNYNYGFDENNEGGYYFCDNKLNNIKVSGGWHL